MKQISEDKLNELTRFLQEVPYRYSAPILSFVANAFEDVPESDPAVITPDAAEVTDNAEVAE